MKHLVTNIMTPPSVTAGSYGGSWSLAVQQKIVTGPRDLIDRTVTLSLSPTQALTLAKELIEKIPANVIENEPPVIVKDILKLLNRAWYAPANQE